MKRKIKSYLVFTSFSYRICVFILLPAVLAGIGIYTESYFGRLGILASAMLLTMAEILSDHWLFSGLLAKESARMDVLKTSGMGMEILKNALTLDLLRKLLTALGLLAVCDLFTGRLGELVSMVLVTYFFSALGTFLARYGGWYIANFCIGQIAALLVMGCLFSMPKPGLFRLGFDLLFLALGILASVLTVDKAIRKGIVRLRWHGEL